MAPSRSLLCAPGPLHPACRGLPPTAAHLPRTHAPLAHRPSPPPFKVCCPPPHTHRAAGFCSSRSA
eukprot:scaffold144173_cov268-Phaeocystis_antarctica.AAC.1